MRNGERQVRRAQQGEAEAFGELVRQFQKAYLERLSALRPSIALAQELVQEFFALTRRRDAAALEPWRERVAARELMELQRFSAGLERDWDAVVAGLTVEWSTGPVEGQINRLKMLKRQMYGRAGVSLLRARVLPLAEAPWGQLALRAITLL